MKENYNKCLKLISKENNIQNYADQKAKEVFLLSSDPNNQENDNLFCSLESIQNENKELKSVYNYLFSLLESKTESGEIPNFIQFSYMSLQNHLNQSSMHDENINNDTHTSSRKASDFMSPDIKHKSKDKTNLPLLQTPQSLPSALSSSSSTPCSPQRQKGHTINLSTEFQNIQKKLLNADDIDILRYSNSKGNRKSEPSSPILNNTQKNYFKLNNNHNNKNNSYINDVTININIENDNGFNKKKGSVSLKEAKTQTKSTFSSSITKNNYPKHNSLPKETKTEFFNRASSIAFNVSRLNDISNLSNQISECQKKIEKLDNKIERMKSLSNNDSQRFFLNDLHLTLEKDVQSFNLSEYADKEVNCEQIPNITEMKQMISKNAGEASQQLLAIQQLQYLQNYIQQLKIELKVIILSNDRKKSDFNNIIANLKSIDPLFYGDIEFNSDKYVTRLGEIKDEKEQRLKAIEKLVNDMKKQNDQIQDKCNDLSFIIENYKKQRMRMMQIPKVNVKRLCNQLKADRSFVNENNRQITFLNIIYNHLDGKVLKLNERYSNESFQKLGNEITLLKSKVSDLKIKFDHLRAARENHSVVLTNANELKFLHTKVHDLISAIDVEKMRISGLISKVEKQTKLLVQQNIPLPNPPHIIAIFQETVMKKKTLHS